MEWLAKIFCWFLPEAVQKAEKASADARHSTTLSKVNLQLNEGHTLYSFGCHESENEEAVLSFSVNSGYLLKITGSSQLEERFDSIEDLDHYLVSNTKFRVGDFLSR